MTPARLYRLAPRADWIAASTGGANVLGWNDDDRRDGFMHLSTHDQVAETARRHYADVSELWIIEIDAAALGPALRWEPSRGGALFPHVHGDIPLTAVIDARPFDPADVP